MEKNVPKGAMDFDLSRYSNSIISESSGSIRCIKIPIDFCRVVTNQLAEKQPLLFLHQNLDCTKVQKNWFWYWLDWVFKLDNLRSYQFGFAHQRVSWKLYSCRGGFNWEVFFDSGIEVLMSKNALNVFNFESRRSSENVSLLVQAWILQSRSDRKKSFLC